jgi:hypothetical protein
MNHSTCGTFDAVAARKVSPELAAGYLIALDYFTTSWRVKLACWANRWWYSKEG